MDPQACLQRIFDLVNDKDKDCYEAAEDLYQWLKKGGHPPVLKSLDDLCPCPSGLKRVTLEIAQHGTWNLIYVIHIQDYKNHSGNGPYRLTVWSDLQTKEFEINFPME